MKKEIKGKICERLGFDSWTETLQRLTVFAVTTLFVPAPAPVLVQWVFQGIKYKTSC